MATFDPNIILQARPAQDPLESYGKALSLKSLGQQQRMQEAQYAKYEEDRAAERTLNDLYRGSVSPTGTVDRNALLSGAAERGLGSRIPTLQKGFADQDKAMAESQATTLKLQKDKLDMAGGAISSLLANPAVTHDDVIMTVNDLVNRGVIDQNQGAQMVRMLPGNPQQLRQFLMQKGLETMDAAKRMEALLPKFEKIDAGNRVITGTSSGLTGEFTPSQAAPIVKAPEGYTVGPDGKLAVDPGYQAGKVAIAKAGKTDVNLNVNTEKTLGTTLAKGVGEQLDAGLASANSAVDTIQSARNLKQILASGNVITGPGADQRVAMLQIARGLGIVGADADTTLANTRSVMQGLAQGELDAAKGMKGQGAMSDAERALLKRVAGGDINLTVPEITSLANAVERNAMSRVSSHKANVERLRKTPGMEALLPFYEAPQVPAEAPSAPAATPAPAAAPAVTWKAAGYASEAQAVQDARSAIAQGADKAAVIQRLEAAGIRNHGIK